VRSQPGTAGPPDAARVVLDLVARVPPGYATTYGDIARAASDVLPRPVTARTVGRILAGHTEDEPWWRVVGHDGRLAPGLADQATRHLREDGCPIRAGRVDLRRARWQL
jgi:methylated-DNA-protein-cysteine methyltransferase related protein